MASEQIDPLAPATVVQHFDPGFDHDLGEYATGADYRLLYAEVKRLREQLAVADRLAEVVGKAGRLRGHVAEALAAYEAARKEEGK